MKGVTSRNVTGHLSATLLHRQIHQCLICAVHQYPTHAKCCSSVPLLVLSKSFKNTATDTRIAHFSNKYDPSHIMPADLKGEKKSEVWGGMEDSHWHKGKSGKKGIVYTKPITRKTVWLHCFMLMPFLANMSLSALAWKTDVTQKPEFIISSLVSSTS